MARFSSRHAFRPNCFGRQARIFNVLSDLQANRFEELNTYSGLMTSHFVAFQIDLQSADSIPLKIALSQTS